MTSFDFEISEKDHAGAEHIARVGRRLIAAFAKKCRAEGLTKVEVARRLETDKGAVTRMLRGDANMTLRTVGELCWALGMIPSFTCADSGQKLAGNEPLPQWTVVSDTFPSPQVQIVSQ